MKKTHIKNKMRNLDNMAKAFCFDNQNNINTFRCTVNLKNKIDKNILEQALDKTLNNFCDFRVKLGNNFFWNHFEFNSKNPIIVEDVENCCKRIDLKKNNDYLFKVSYYKNQINLDVIHVLTDGTGALVFFKSIVCNYLDIKFNINKNKISNEGNIGCLDQYLKVYDKKLMSKENNEISYLFSTKANKKYDNFNCYSIDITELKLVCKKYNATITEYLTAIYIYAMYLAMHNKKTKKEIIITIPINLRSYYNLETLSNFFVCMNINPRILANNLTNFNEVLDGVCYEFNKKLTKDKVKEYLSRDVKLGTNPIFELIPLHIKKFFMQNIAPIITKPTTSTLSNLGIIEIDNNYKDYIDNIIVSAMPCKIQKIKCVASTFNNKLNIVITSSIDDSNFQSVLLELISKDIKNIRINTCN